MSRELVGDADQEQVGKESGEVWCRRSVHLALLLASSLRIAASHLTHPLPFVALICFQCVFSLQPQNNLVGWYYLSYFTDEKTEAQPAQTTCSRPQGQFSGRSGTVFKSYDPQSPVFSPFLDKENRISL